MKILVLSNYYPEHQGGIEFVAKNLVNRWRSAHQVRWIACDDPHRPHVVEPGDVPLASINFAEERLGFPYPVPMGDAAQRIFQEVEQCDVVHIHDSLYLANLVAFLASRLYHKPCLVTQHVAAIHYPQRYKNALQAVAYSTIGRFVLSRAERVVFVSRRVQDWFQPRVKFHSEPAFIPNGVDRQLFHPAAGEERLNERGRLGLSPDDRVCLYVGRFTHKKGLNFIHELAKAQPAVQWILLGAGELSPEGWSLPNVRVLGPQTQSVLQKFYTVADLLVLPSVGEGFPLVVQEALTCGLPAAISDELARQVPDAPVIALDVQNPLELQRVFDETLSNRPVLKSMSLRAVQYARKWDWEAVARDYEDLLLECIDS